MPAAINPAGMNKCAGGFFEFRNFDARLVVLPLGDARRRRRFRRVLSRYLQGSKLIQTLVLYGITYTCKRGGGCNYFYGRCNVLGSICNLFWIYFSHIWGLFYDFSCL